MTFYCEKCGEYDPYFIIGTVCLDCLMGEAEKDAIVKEYVRRAETPENEWIDVPEGEGTMEFLEREAKAEGESK